MMEDLLVQDKLAKADLSRSTMAYPNDKYKGSDKFLVAHRDARLRLGTQPAIWSMKFWMKWMNPGYSPWEYELNQKAFDDELIVGTREQIFVYSNVYNKGSSTQDQINLLSEEDKKELVVPLTGRLGNGRYSNVFKSQLEPDSMIVSYEAIRSQIDNLVFRNGKGITCQVQYSFYDANGRKNYSESKMFKIDEFKKFFTENEYWVLEWVKSKLPTEGTNKLLHFRNINDPKVYCRGCFRSDDGKWASDLLKSKQLDKAMWPKSFAAFKKVIKNVNSRIFKEGF